MWLATRYDCADKRLQWCADPFWPGRLLVRITSTLSSAHPTLYYQYYRCGCNANEFALYYAFVVSLNTGCNEPLLCILVAVHLTLKNSSFILVRSRQSQSHILARVCSRKPPCPGAPVGRTHQRHSSCLGASRTCKSYSQDILRAQADGNSPRVIPHVNTLVKQKAQAKKGVMYPARYPGAPFFSLFLFIFFSELFF